MAIARPIRYNLPDMPILKQASLLPAGIQIAQKALLSHGRLGKASTYHGGAQVEWFSLLIITSPPPPALYHYIQIVLCLPAELAMNRALLRRKAAPELPTDPMHLVMHKLEKMGSVKEVANLRCVSKAWHAAFTDFPEEASFHLKSDSDIAQLCGLMPNMQSLIISDASIFPDLKHYLFLLPADKAACKPVRFSYTSNGPQQFDVAHLPGGLRELALHGFPEGSSSGSLLLRANKPGADLRCPHLTKLAVSCGAGGIDDLDTSLNRLPGLKVRVIFDLSY